MSNPPVACCAEVEQKKSDSPPVSIGSASTADCTEVPAPPGPSLSRSLTDADVKHTSLNLKHQIADVDATPLGCPCGPLSYEMRMFAKMVPPMLMTLGLLYLLFMPFYQYAKDACDELESIGFEPDPELSEKLGVPDDDRFVSTYSVPGQIGQLYDGILTRTPAWLAMPGLFVPLVYCVAFVLMSTSASPLAIKDGVVQTYASILEAAWMLRYLFLFTVVTFTALQGTKSIGVCPAKVGSFLSLVFTITLQYKICRALGRFGADTNIIKGFSISLDIVVGTMIVVCQYLLKLCKTDFHLAMLWVLWCVVGEAATAYWRSKLRVLNLAACDPRWVPYGYVPIATTINVAKRIPLLSVTGYDYIIGLNIISMCVEIANRVTVLQRDKFIDTWILKKPQETADEWKVDVRRQVYLHCEMLQEMLELLYPIPMTVILYQMQFSPQGVAVALAPMMTNCVLQLVQEVVADCTAIWYGSRYQGKFYRTAFSNLFTWQQYVMCSCLVSLTAVVVLGLFFLLYLRVGKTADGDYVTLI